MDLISTSDPLTITTYDNRVCTSGWLNLVSE